MKRLILLFLLCTGCSFDHQKLQSASADSLNQRPVAYNDVFQAVFAPKCLSCHSAAGGNKGSINLETYESAIAVLGKIERSALQAKTMPPGQPLAEQESRVLSAWIEQGASLNGSQKSSSRLKQGQVNWPLIRDEIFEKSCFDCHSGAHSEANLDLSSLPDVRAKMGKIFERSVVIQDMPLAPFDRLSLDEKQALAQWVALGMPE